MVVLKVGTKSMIFQKLRKHFSMDESFTFACLIIVQGCEP